MTIKWFDELVEGRMPDGAQIVGYTDELMRVALPIRKWFEFAIEGLDGWVELSLRYPGEAPLTLWAECSDYDRLTWLAVVAAEYNVNRGYGVSYSPCPRKAPAEYGRGKAEDALCVPMLWTDIDNPTAGQVEQLYRMEPSFILETGGGYHAYWKLDEPAPADETTRNILRNIAEQLNADKAVAEFSRVMRIVGSYNTKPERDNWQVRYAESGVNSRRVYSHLNLIKTPQNELQSVRQVYFKPPTGYQRQLPQWAEDRIAYGAQPGQRNNDLFYLACTCAEHGLSEAETLSLFSHWEEPDFPASEIRGLIESVFRSQRRGQLRGLSPDRPMSSAMLDEQSSNAYRRKRGK